MTIASAASVVVRPSTDDDLVGIGRLFSPAKRPDLLRWLLMHPGGGGSCRSFVAIDGGDVAGHVGYTKSSFVHDGRSYTGVFPIAWKVKPGLNRAAGLRLISRVFAHGDFSYIIGGTGIARQMYNALGYQHLLSAGYYTKPLHIWGAQRGPLYRRIGAAVRDMSRSMVGQRRSGGLPRVSSLKMPLAGPYVVNDVRAETVRWAVAAPGLEGHVLPLADQARESDSAACYVARRDGQLRGTIVHLPYLGEEEGAWLSAIEKLEGFFDSKGCVEMTLLASHPTLRRVLAAQGFRQRRELPLWYRGKAQGPGGVSTWHLTLLEGDLAYRK
jgi:hypothetical protein